VTSPWVVIAVVAVLGGLLWWLSRAVLSGRLTMRGHSSDAASSAFSALEMGFAPNAAAAREERDRQRRVPHEAPAPDEPPWADLGATGDGRFGGHLVIEGRPGADSAPREQRSDP
jgi:hypothetical protein